MTHFRLKRAAVFVTLTLLMVAHLHGLQATIAFAQGSKSDYERWQSYGERTSGLVYRDRVAPNMIECKPSLRGAFWYRVTTGRKSHEFVLVIPQRSERAPAFNHDRLATLLTEATSKSIDAKELPFRTIQLSDDLQDVKFRFAGVSYTYRRPDGPLERAAELPVGELNRSSLPARSFVERSGPSITDTEIRITNSTDQPLDVFWVKSDGQQVKYGSVNSGKTFQSHTFVSHAWLLKNADDEAVGCFVAADTSVQATVDATTPRPRKRQRRSRMSSGSRNQSPDGRYRVLFDDHNVTLIDSHDKDRRRVLTQDGKEADAFGGRVWWSPSSDRFVVLRTRQGSHRMVHIVESSPKGSTDPKLISFRYDKPGDQIDQSRPYLFDCTTGAAKPIDDSLFPNPFSIRELKWHEDGNRFSFLYNQRGHQILRLIEVDAETASARTVIDETSETFVCYSQKNYLKRIDETDEAIWMSERSGWNHLYLINAATGQVKNAITAGEWVVREVERIDTASRQVWLKVSGRNSDEDPYHVHLMRVRFDGTDPLMLTAGDGNHTWQWIDDNSMLIDTYSRVDLPSITVLRDAETGRKICDLEKADIRDLLATGWTMPERFVCKGRDGQTDIHGIIVRPTNHDPSKRYPILESIYAGPHGAFVPKSFSTHRSLGQMAELGFVVVKIDGMGTNFRSKAFHDVCWKNLGDSGFPDRVKWIRAAAEARSDMDVDHVGIWGGSAGGQSSMRALVTHGDFYDVAVADCGCHDNRVDKIWWNEQWMGWPIGQHYAEQSNVTGASEITGDLMLIVGELDRNVDPASTMQVVDALVKADKDFELLVIPGTGHGAAETPYGKRRRADFLVRKLWGTKPRQ